MGNVIGKEIKMFCVVETVIPITTNDEILLELAGSLGVTCFERYAEATEYIRRWFTHSKESDIHDIVYYSDTKLITIEYNINGDFYHIFDIQHV